MTAAAHTGTVDTIGKTFDVQRVRRDFPILAKTVRGKKLVYLDNAATSQKPQAVIDAVQAFYEGENANVHRGVHFLSERATQLYEGSRAKAQRFLNASKPLEIIFVRGTTEGINLVAQSFVRRNLQSGDEILISGMEHHSNIVPWQLVCQETGARLQVIPVNDAGELELDAFKRLLTSRTKFVTLGHVSNALGTINPIKEMTQLAHDHGVPVLIDGAQAVPHQPVDVRDLGCDFYACSSHKMFGPTGVGILFGKEERLSAMPPYQGGGDMIKSVSFEKTVYNDLPYKFEAGTPNIAGAIGLGAAIEYLEGLNWSSIEAHEREVLSYATEALMDVPGLRIIGTAKEKTGVISFVMEDVHPHDIGTILDGEGIAVRTGHHCAQPVMERFSVPATARASFAFYNTREEVDALVRGIQKVREVFA